MHIHLIIVLYVEPTVGFINDSYTTIEGNALDVCISIIIPDDTVSLDDLTFNLQLNYIPGSAGM